MASSHRNEKTRQIYASIREDLYLAAKARATERRIPLRAFIEHALEQVLSGNSTAPQADSSVWDDEYLEMQAQQPVGSPVELTKAEAETVVRAAFGSQVGGHVDGGRHRSNG